MIDITRALSTATAAWPGDTALVVDWPLRIADGDAVSVSRLTLSPHVGTHADAPAHYMADGATTGAFDLAAFIGVVRVVDARGRQLLNRDVFADHDAIGDRRILVRTLDEVRPEEFMDSFPPLEPAAALELVRAGLILYGTDTPSVDAVDSATMDAHRALGVAGVPILENLDLSGAEPGVYDLVALPIKLVDADATPVRAVLFPPGSLGLER